MDHAGTRLAREGSGVPPALQRRGMLLIYIFGLHGQEIQRFPGKFFRADRIAGRVGRGGRANVLAPGVRAVR